MIKKIDSWTHVTYFRMFKGLYHSDHAMVSWLGCLRCHSWHSNDFEDTEDASEQGTDPGHDSNGTRKLRTASIATVVFAIGRPFIYRYSDDYHQTCQYQYEVNINFSLFINLEFEMCT